MDTGIRIGIARAGGREKEESWFNGCGSSVWDDGKFLKWLFVVVARHCKGS